MTMKPTMLSIRAVLLVAVALSSLSTSVGATDADADADTELTGFRNEYVVSETRREWSENKLQRQHHDRGRQQQR